MALRFASTAPINVSRNVGLSIAPEIAVSLPLATLTPIVGQSSGSASRQPTLHRQTPSPSVYVVWEDKSAVGSDYHVYFSMSHDGGLTFSAPRNLSNSTYWSGQPQIAVGGNNVYVIWKRHTIGGGGDGEIFFARSADRGLTFGAPVNLSNNSADSRPPKLAVWGDNVYVVWTDDFRRTAQISLRKSGDGGATFSPTTVLGDNAWFYSMPEIVANGSEVYVVWNDKDRDISFCRSTNSGGTFSAPTNLSHNPAASWYPQMAVSGGNVYIVWSDIAPGIANIAFTRSGNSGVSFSNPVNVSPGSRNPQDPGVSASGVNVYLIWDDLVAGGRQVFFARSTNNGASFQAPRTLSQQPADLDGALLAADGNEIFVSWMRATGSIGGAPNFDVVLTCSADGGTTFTLPTDFTHTPSNRSAYTRIVDANHVAYIVWSEGSLTDADILLSTATLYEDDPFVPGELRERRPPDLPYIVDLMLPPRRRIPPPGPPPPVKRSVGKKNGRR